MINSSTVSRLRPHRNNFPRALCARPLWPKCVCQIKSELLHIIAPHAGHSDVVSSTRQEPFGRGDGTAFARSEWEHTPKPNEQWWNDRRSDVLPSSLPDRDSSVST